MKKEIAISLSYINLNSVVNKLLFRLRHEPQKEEGIKRQIDDLDLVRNTMRFLENENETLHKRIMEVELRAMILEEKLKLIRDENKEVQEL